MRIVSLAVWEQLAALGVTFKHDRSKPYHQHGEDWYDRGELWFDGVRQEALRERAYPPTDNVWFNTYATATTATPFTFYTTSTITTINTATSTDCINFIT